MLPHTARMCGSLSVCRRRQGATKDALDAQKHAWILLNSAANTEQGQLRRLVGLILST